MTRRVAPTCIDLFAGCGGLSLGLEQAGFQPVFVNELNRDAMESYLLNRSHLRVDLRESRRHSFNIQTITSKPSKLKDLADFLKAEHGEIDLVVGGPPCQGYSGIGHRRTFDIDKSEIPSNHLYRDMAKFVEVIQPRAFLFENVRGLLSARWSKDGAKGEIWDDVQRAFQRIGGRNSLKQYSIGSALVFAKNYGVPQNRPRILLVGIREDITWNSQSKIAGGRLPDPVGYGPNLIDLLGDLIDPEWQQVSSTLKYPHAAQTTVQKLLRTDLSGVVAKKGSPISEMEYSNHSDEVSKKFKYMLKHDGKIPLDMQTKKFAQRLLPMEWPKSGPSITATSLPDDYVHFTLPRVLTVREWARLQFFPDWYQFSGKRTTGGRRRAGDPDSGDWSRDLPKYTQIGNAVPVSLAKHVGRHLLEIISE